MYNVQLNVYNYLRVESGKSAANRLFLIYLEPLTHRENGAHHEDLNDEGYHLDFNAKVVELELKNEDYVPALLTQLQKLCNLKTAPASADGCKECKLLDLLVAAVDAEVREVDAVEVRDILTMAQTADGTVQNAIRRIRKLALCLARERAKKAA